MTVTRCDRCGDDIIRPKQMSGAMRIVFMQDRFGARLGTQDLCGSCLDSLETWWRVGVAHDGNDSNV